MKVPINPQLMERISRAVRDYGRIDTSQLDIQFFQYSKGERARREGLELTWWDSQDRSINVEIPTIGNIKNPACLAFIFLHELAHADGIYDEEEASSLAVESLKDGNLLDPQAIESLRRRWQLANGDTDFLARTVELIMIDEKIDSTKASEEEMDDALDKARIRVLCGDQRPHISRLWKPAEHKASAKGQ